MASSGLSVYVAGPITQGDQFLNVRAAIMAGEQLRQAGLVPYVPHLNALWHMIVPVDYEGWMALDFYWLKQCDALLRLPGESPGADREVSHARLHMIPVYHSVQAVIDKYGQHGQHNQ